MISPTNSILVGLAVSDMLVMVDYIPFSIHSYIHINQTYEDMFSYGWTIFALFHAHFSVVCHAISTWMTVLLAVWRYISVRHPAKARGWCSQQRAYRLIFLTYVGVIVACIPIYLSLNIIQKKNRSFDSTNNSPTYVVSLSQCLPTLFYQRYCLCVTRRFLCQDS